MMVLAEMNGDRISPIGPRMPWSGSKRPHDLLSSVGSEALAEVTALELASPLRRLPPLVDLLAFKPEVPVRGRALTPALRALTKSLQ